MTDDIQLRFVEFDASHPEVYTLFKQFANQLKGAGRNRYGSDAILQRIRWEYAVNPNHDGGFKINDHFSSRYARKLIEEDSSFSKFFQLRKLRGERAAK